jgi:hypothetical protein
MISKSIIIIMEQQLQAKPMENVPKIAWLVVVFFQINVQNV